MYTDEELNEIVGYCMDMATWEIESSKRYQAEKNKIESSFHNGQAKGYTETAKKILKLIEEKQWED